MDCEFSEPVNLGIELEDWEYSRVVCELKNYELIQATSTEAEFYFNKSISYGDVVLWYFLTIFLVYLITKTIWNFVWKK